jgi:hypothetical protein
MQENIKDWVDKLIISTEELKNHTIEDIHLLAKIDPIISIVLEHSEKQKLTLEQTLIEMVVGLVRGKAIMLKTMMDNVQTIKVEVNGF